LFQILKRKEKTTKTFLGQFLIFEKAFQHSETTIPRFGPRLKRFSISGNVAGPNSDVSCQINWTKTQKIQKQDPKSIYTNPNPKMSLKTYKKCLLGFP
jgi:hypothetical protein